MAEIIVTDTHTAGCSISWALTESRSPGPAGKGISNSTAVPAALNESASRLKIRLMKKELAVSRILSCTTIYLRDQPGESASSVILSLFGLASSGVCPAGRLPGPPVSSYLTISPLPRQAEAVMFLWHFPSGRPAPACAGHCAL